MTVQNGFSDIVLTKNDGEERFPLKHLENHFIVIPEFLLESNQTVDLKVYIRPTNHLYSRRPEKGVDNLTKLSATGELLLRYEHAEGNYQAVKEGMISPEKRIFCLIKYEQSFMFPSFVQSLQQNPSQLCILPNPGDRRTCLSALVKLPEPWNNNDLYLVIFRLHKINSREINMLIETAFVVLPNDNRAERLTAHRYKDDRKPFLVLLRNVLAGRLPFEGKAKTAAKKAYKKKKRK